MSHHLTLKPKGEAKETKAGRGWVAQGHTASKQQNMQVQTWIYPQGLLWLPRERAKVTLFLISDETGWKKKI